MNVTWQWSPEVAAQEGDILNANLIQSMMAYVQSFPMRQQIYQRIQTQELDWIQAVLAHHQLPTSGALTPQSLWAAEFLARHLRAMALSILTNQPEPFLQELVWGEIETSLDLAALLGDLVGVMQQHCSEPEQRIAQPLWDRIHHLTPTSTPAPTAAVGIPAPHGDPPAELPTLMDMFV